MIEAFDAFVKYIVVGDPKANVFDEEGLWAVFDEKVVITKVTQNAQTYSKLLTAGCFGTPKTSGYYSHRCFCAAIARVLAQQIARNRGDEIRAIKYLLAGNLDNELEDKMVNVLDVRMVSRSADLRIGENTPHIQAIMNRALTEGLYDTIGRNAEDSEDAEDNEIALLIADYRERNDHRMVARLLAWNFTKSVGGPTLH